MWRQTLLAAVLPLSFHDGIHERMLATLDRVEAARGFASGRSH